MQRRDPGNCAGVRRVSATRGARFALRAAPMKRDVMTVHLPPREHAFPKAAPAPVPGNAWGSQWKHLPRKGRVLVRHAIDGLRAMRLG